jgi:hypothetical protein
MSVGGKVMSNPAAWHCGCFIQVFDPHQHPGALVRRLVAVMSECGDVRSAAASSLPSLTKKNLACAGPHRPERRRRPPSPRASSTPISRTTRSSPRCQTHWMGVIPLLSWGGKDTTTLFR